MTIEYINLFNLEILLSKKQYFGEFYMDTKNEKRSRKQLFRQIAAIILLNILIISAVGYAYTKSTATLSKIGSRGQEVRLVQKKLKELGMYKGSVDGIFGTDTKKAVRQFQKSRGLTADGIAGPKTLLYLGITDTSQSSSFSNNDIYLLAKVISAEARGEGYTGQVAVGAVVLNRVRHSSFPDSISGVVYQPGAFSAVRDSNWKVEPDASAKKAARDAINGWDPTGGALYYYNPAKTNNKWIRSRPVITTIGKHIFCK